MVKNILLLFSMFIMLLFQNMFSDGITVTQKVPEKVTPGSEFNIEVTINKGQIAGFAKVQFELPPGFTASSVENKGSSFTFSDQKVKFIWMSIPSESNFTIIYKVKASENVSGSSVITGAFSYLESNDKKVFTIPEASLNVEGETLASTDSENEDDEEQEDEEETASNNEESENNSENNDQGDMASTSNTSVVVSEISCVRKIDQSNLANREFTVEVTVNKGNVSGFAKLQETIPSGFTATAIEVKNGVFSFVDQKAKFLWMSLPNEEEFKVSYKVKIDDNITGTYYINGEMSYLVNEETTKFIIEPQSVTISGAPIADNTEDPDNSNDNDYTENTDNDTETQTNEFASNTVSNNDAGNNQNSTDERVQVKTEKAVTNTPAPQNGVKYRVQIAAGHTIVPTSYFKAKYGLSDQIYTEMHEGWNKYTIGGFAEYKEARNTRESVTQTYSIDTGPFVAAYNDGKRITVQEALMVTNQKWYQ